MLRTYLNWAKEFKDKDPKAKEVYENVILINENPIPKKKVVDTWTDE